MTAPTNLPRCAWADGASELMRRYHDEEWGVPEHDDRKLFELLVLEGAQAGLSWETILRKREGYRAALAGFDYEKVAAFGPDDVARLMQDAAIVRNRMKIASAIANAKALLAVRAEIGSFDALVWRFVDGKPKRNAFHALSDLPAKTAESEALSKELRRRGFGFVGPTVCYAFMQAAGLVNDHVVGCWRYERV